MAPRDRRARFPPCSIAALAITAWVEEQVVKKWSTELESGQPHKSHVGEGMEEFTEVPEMEIEGAGDDAVQALTTAAATSLGPPTKRPTASWTIVFWVAESQRRRSWAVESPHTTFSTQRRGRSAMR